MVTKCVNNKIGNFISILYFIPFLCIFLISNSLLHSQVSAVKDSTKNSSLVIIPSRDGIDTVNHPGDIYENTLYTKEQDSAYKRAMELKIPQECRLLNDFRQQMGTLTPDMNRDETIWQSYERIFNIPTTVYIPLGTDLVQRYEAMQRSQGVDGVRGLPKIGAGVQVSFETIGKLFGLVEDVSPLIVYELFERSEVEIVIYSIQATVICTIFRKTQMPGKYDITWNGRNDSGMKVPPGDYVAEVRIGKQRLKVKRIRIN